MCCTGWRRADCRSPRMPLRARRVPFRQPDLDRSCASRARPISAITASVRPWPPQVEDRVERVRARFERLALDGRQSAPWQHSKGAQQIEQQWLQAPREGPFLRKARSEGYRSRARLQAHRGRYAGALSRPGARVVDLGAAPGAGRRLRCRKVAPGGKVIAVICSKSPPCPE